MSNKLKLFGLVGFVLGVLLIAGCQQKKESPKIAPSVPFSNGPSSPPSVSGPTSPPPTTTDEPQSVTETENVRYSIPSNSN